jgi:mannose-6-phosphate isomerase-like protein (cupin superfamily)
MANYTLKNLKHVEDQAPKFGLSPALEGRFASGELECRNFGVSYQRLAPNFRIPFGHKHAQQEELYIVVSGSGRVKLDDEVVDVKQWDALRVDKDTTRNFEAGAEGAEILAFGAPATGPGDAETAPGWWSD